MASLQRDDNRKPVGGAINLSDLLTPLPLNVDPATDRLLIDITLSNNNSSIVPSEVGHDVNRRTTVYGVTDDAFQNLSPLIIDHTNGYLFVDITFT